MIKDAAQKQKAVRYCVAHGYVPYMECIVRFSGDTSDSISDITDVDVLGLRPASEAPARRVVFDCKTLAKTSGVNRALWAAGLQRLVGADEAFVILIKAAPHGHRLAASKVDVHLFSEILFDQYAQASSIDYVENITYLDDLRAWDALWDIRTKLPRAAALVEYLTSEAAFEQDPASGFRALLSRLKQAEGEFDVSKPEHRMLYGILVSQATAYLADVVRNFNTIFDPSMKLDAFQKSLRNYIWGGREGYELRKRLQAALHADRPEDGQEVQLPGWDAFVELVRSLLDAPILVGSSALPIKDLAFRELGTPSILADARIKRELTSNPRARQFALAVNRYIGSLSRLLQDCSEHLKNEVVRASI
jgi:hypothetical protein